MKTGFSDAIGSALKYRDIKLDEEITEKFNDTVADFEKDLDRETDRLERTISDMLDKLSSNFKVDIRSRKDNIIEQIFSNLSKS